MAEAIGRAVPSFMAKSIGYEADISPFPWSHPRLVPERLRVEVATPPKGAYLPRALSFGRVGWLCAHCILYGVAHGQTQTSKGARGMYTALGGERYGQAWGLSGRCARRLTRRP